MFTQGKFLRQLEKSTLMPWVAKQWSSGQGGRGGQVRSCPQNGQNGQVSRIGWVSQGGWGGRGVITFRMS